jgi:hypothetical protein
VPFERNDTIFAHPDPQLSGGQYLSRGSRANRDLYFFRIVKEQLQPVDSGRVECSALKKNDSALNIELWSGWWR